MTIEEKREIWEVVLESARHSALAPYILVNELVAAHGVLYGDDPHRNPVFPMTAEEVEAVANPDKKKDNGQKKNNYYFNEKGELVIPGGDSETARQVLAALRCKKAAAAALRELESTPK